MGFLDFLTGLFGSQESSTADSSSQTSTSSGLRVDLPNVEYQGNRFFSEASESENGEWIVVYGKAMQVENEIHRLFLLREEELQFTKELKRIEDARISDTGSVLAIDGESREDLSGRLYVFNRSGDQVFSQGFDANVGASALSSDGRYAAVATLNPDCSTYVFDLSESRQVLKHENQEGNKMGLEYKDEEGETRVYLSESPDSGPLYAIDLGGDVVWRSEELQRKHRLQELMDSSETEDLEEALDLLDEAYELADGENEKKNVAQKLADTHWSLAKSSENDSDEWWQHLNQAKAYYTEILPWYDGKQGVAKVSRKQGKYYLKQDQEEAALEMFQNIADLEEEYDVQLLTDADERKLEELSQES
ncbi:hypothetical protein [Halobellus clavatus]|uniref:Uncharacterized protein n=1 Tax=Halobellus clavatus TaxID=660517 RepID=A0A1H3DGF1_9EURY|nr:hypothetical protein [Halobellus clavatus]SDX65441.1 hypothetical protein SAMN04487946_101559 [Halobellus clavatus]